MIGGEREKIRPCWICDVMNWIVIGGEPGKVGHVGFGRHDLCPNKGAVNQSNVTGSGSQNTGSGSKNVKMFFIS